MKMRILHKIFICVMAAVTAVLAVVCTGCADSTEGVTAATLPEITIGIDEFEPFSFNDKNGIPSGTDVELAQEVCRRIGYKPVFRYITWNEKDKYLADGSIDCIWSCFSMNDREEKYFWVGPYMNSRQVVAVKDDSDIYRLSDLEGRQIAVQSSTKAEQLFSEYGDLLPKAGNLYSFKEKDYIFASLRKGYVDAISGHEYMIREFLNESEGEYRLLEESPLVSKLGIAFIKGHDSELPDKLKGALKETLEDGTAAKIAEKYGLDAVSAFGGLALE